jgi:glutathione S-transferase
MSSPTLHGPGFSTYTRSVRITLAEKGVAYDLHEINFLEGWPDGYEKLHPFTKVPVFEHDSLIVQHEVWIFGFPLISHPGNSI